jgi:hypothetical protein
MQSKSPEQEVDQPHLTDLVRKALDRPALQITDWKVQPLHGGMGLRRDTFPGTSLSRADLATFLLEQIQDMTWLQQAPAISN